MRATLFALAIACFGLIGCGDEAPAETTTTQAEAPVQQTPTPRQGQGGKGRKGKGRRAAVGASQAAATTGGTAAVTFVINTHDWYFHDDSAATLSRCMDILDKHGVKGEFYFTSALFRVYQEHHPELLQRLQDTGMGIGYHVRAPHPVTFRGPTANRLQNMPHDQAVALMTQYETQRLDLSTGQLDAGQVGGYQLLKDALGYGPPAVGFNPKGDTLKQLELEVLSSLGAKMWVRKHTGDVMEPTEHSMYARPSQFSISKVDGEHWWKSNVAYDPAEMFAGAHGYGVVLIHEHDFYAQSPGWGEIYFADGKQHKPPFDLTVRAKPEQRYPDDHVAQTWANWEGFVAYAAENLRVVTSKDIIADYEASH